MKKIQMVLCILSMFAFLLTACGGVKQPAETATANAQATEDTAEEQTVAADRETTEATQADTVPETTEHTEPVAPEQTAPVPAAKPGDSTAADPTQATTPEETTLPPWYGIDPGPNQTPIG